MTPQELPIGIETTREVKSIHKVSQIGMTKENLRALMEDGDGRRDGSRVERAEENLRIAIRRFLKWCPHTERFQKIIAEELE